MSRHTKRTVLLCLLVGLAAILLLSMSLSTLNLQPGSPMPGAAEVSRAIQAATPQLKSVARSLGIVEAVLGVALIVLMIYVPARLVTMINIRKLLPLLLAAFFIAVVLGLLPFVFLQLPSSNVASSPSILASDQSISPPALPGQISPPWMWLAGALFLAGLGFVAAQILSKGSGRNAAMDALSQTAEDALRDLGSGIDFPNVIVACYMQMNQILLTERKLERHHTMTVREFEHWLELQGLPDGPVHRLTALFEKARYGNEHMSPADEISGRESLEQIIYFCRKGSPRSP